MYGLTFFLIGKSKLILVCESLARFRDGRGVPLSVALQEAKHLAANWALWNLAEPPIFIKLLS